LLGAAIVVGLAFAAGACGDDSPYVQKDAGPDPVVTFTSYVIDLVNNHTDSSAPVPYTDFKDLPDPDGEANNTAAYGSLFP
jgi:hypothetical protein